MTSSARNRKAFPVVLAGSHPFSLCEVASPRPSLEVVFGMFPWTAGAFPGSSPPCIFSPPSMRQQGPFLLGPPLTPLPRHTSRKPDPPVPIPSFFNSPSSPVERVRASFPFRFESCTRSFFFFISSSRSVFVGGYTALPSLSGPMSSFLWLASSGSAFLFSGSSLPSPFPLVTH